MKVLNDLLTETARNGDDSFLFKLELRNTINIDTGESLVPCRNGPGQGDMVHRMITDHQDGENM